MAQEGGRGSSPGKAYPRQASIHCSASSRWVAGFLFLGMFVPFDGGFCVDAWGIKRTPDARASQTTRMGNPGERDKISACTGAGKAAGDTRTDGDG